MLTRPDVLGREGGDRAGSLCREELREGRAGAWGEG